MLGYNSSYSIRFQFIFSADLIWRDQLQSPNMGSAYIKAKKKFISKELVMKKLKIHPKEFDKLVVLCGIHPYIPKDNRKSDEAEGFYYRISDANKLVHSDIYRTIIKNRRLEERKQRYVGTGLEYKINNICYEEYGYVDLVKNKYKSFCESLDDLSRSLSNLYLGRMLELDNEAMLTTSEFEEFVARRSLLEHSFMSKSGVYHQVSFGKIKVIWFVPYPGVGLKEIVEEKKDVAQKFEWSELNFLDFVSSSEEESESEEMEVVNDENKMDISLLSYSIPFLVIHCKLVLHKLEKLYDVQKDHGNRFFSGLKFYIKSSSVGDHLRFIAVNCGGEVVSSAHEADVYVSEVADELVEDVLYVQPQYLFDCLNEGCRIDANAYFIGKVLPRHKSPFVSSNHVIPSESLITMSKTQRNRVEDIVNQFEDVEYET